MSTTAAPANPPALSPAETKLKREIIDLATEIAHLIQQALTSEPTAAQKIKAHFLAVAGKTLTQLTQGPFDDATVAHLKAALAVIKVPEGAAINWTQLQTSAGEKPAAPPPPAAPKTKTPPPAPVVTPPPPPPGDPFAALGETLARAMKEHLTPTQTVPVNVITEERIREIIGEELAKLRFTIGLASA